ncbi:YpzI family protein [Schinkia sp. CFF1]
MGKDRQEKKLRESKKVASDRDPELHNKGATILEGPEASRELNK